MGATPISGEVACALSYSAFNSSTKVNATSTSSWSCTTSTRLMSGNGIPDHSVVGGSFATPISAQNLAASFPKAPVVTSTSGTALVRKPYGYALNSVKFDPATDGTCASTATSTGAGRWLRRGDGSRPLAARSAWRSVRIRGR